MPRHIIDGVGALDLDRVELRIVNDEVLALEAAATHPDVRSTALVA